MSADMLASEHDENYEHADDGLTVIL